MEQETILCSLSKQYIHIQKCAYSNSSIFMKMYIIYIIIYTYIYVFFPPPRLASLLPSHAGSPASSQLGAAAGLHCGVPSHTPRHGGPLRLELGQEIPLARHSSYCSLCASDVEGGQAACLLLEEDCTSQLGYGSLEAVPGPVSQVGGTSRLESIHNFMLTVMYHVFSMFCAHLRIASFAGGS